MLAQAFNSYCNKKLKVAISILQLPSLLCFMHSRKQVNLAEDGDWERITFSQNVHYTNVWWWINLLRTKIQIGQQSENRMAAIS